MNKIINTSNSGFQQEFENLLNTNRSDDKDVKDVVVKIINDVRTKGDDALIEYTNQLDRNELSKSNFILDETAINNQTDGLPEKICKAIQTAADRVRAYHEKQLPQDLSFNDDLKSTLGYMWKPLETAGIYVPGGTASYPSTVLMNAIPAMVAGVKDIVMATPLTDGQINPSVLYAAKIVGIKKIYCMGGSQAVAAMAYGTESVAPVNKIVGPGNIYVAEAKRQVSGFVGIDMFAGPSEIVVISDQNSDPKIISADLIAQSEHDKSAQSILITTDQALAEAVEKEVPSQLESLPRKEIASASWDSNGKIIVVRDLKEAFDISNQLAPEHLELAIDNARDFLKYIVNAGAVFLGRNTPEALGDYVAGPSHVLPTSRSAKFSSGLSVFDFLKKISLVEFTKEGIEEIGNSAMTIADNEGLDGHSRSIEYRLTKK